MCNVYLLNLWSCRSKKIMKENVEFWSATEMLPPVLLLLMHTLCPENHYFTMYTWKKHSSNYYTSRFSSLMCIFVEKDNYHNFWRNSSRMYLKLPCDYRNGRWTFEQMPPNHIMSTLLTVADREIEFLQMSEVQKWKRFLYIVEIL